MFQIDKLTISNITGHTGQVFCHLELPQLQEITKFKFWKDSDITKSNARKKYYLTPICYPRRHFSLCRQKMIFLKLATSLACGKLNNLQVKKHSKTDVIKS